MLSQIPIQGVGEGRFVAFAEGRGAAADFAGGAHGLHEIAHIQALADIVGGELFAAG